MWIGFSRPVPSTTRPPIPGNQIKWLVRALLATKRKLQPDRNRHAHFSTPQLRRPRPYTGLRERKHIDRLSHHRCIFRARLPTLSLSAAFSPTGCLCFLSKSASALSARSSKLRPFDRERARIASQVSSSELNALGEVNMLSEANRV
jgi:hypothetical protein